jgi:hypothetical protein
MNKVFPFLALAVLLIASLACASSTTTPTPTPVSAAAIALTMLSDKVNAEATQQKFNSIAAITQQVEASTATQQAFFVQQTQTEQARIDAQSTSDKADANAQATAQQERHDAQATQQRIDAEATQQALNLQATQQRIDFESTQEQARRDLSATQQAEGTATTWSVTQAIIPTHDYWTQQAVQQDVLIATNDVELSNLKVKQQRDTNVLQWFIPMLIAIILTVALVDLARKYLKVREIKNAEGGTDAVIFDNEKMIAPKLFPKPVLELQSGEMHDVTDEKNQAEIVKRAQAVDALSVMPDHPGNNATGVFNSTFSGAPKDNLPFDVIDADEQPPAGLLDDQTLQTLRKDWKEAKSDE